MYDVTLYLQNMKAYESRNRGRNFVAAAVAAAAAANSAAAAAVASDVEKDVGGKLVSSCSHNLEINK